MNPLPPIVSVTAGQMTLLGEELQCQFSSAHRW